MSVLTILIVLVCLVLVTILFTPFILSSRLARQEERHADRRTAELRAFIEELKKEESAEILSAGKHRELRRYYDSQVEAVIDHPTSVDMEFLFDNEDNLDHLSQMVKDIQNQTLYPNNNNYDHRD